MPARPLPSGRLRKRINRRLYGMLVRAYRTLFPAPPWTGGVSPASIRRLLIVQPYGVGDMILTTPLIAFIADQLPRTELDVLASPRNAAVVRDDDRITNVFVRERSRRRWVATVRRLRARRYDLVISGQAGRHLAEGLTAVAVSHRTTYRVSVWRPKRYHGLFSAVVRVPRSVRHTADRLLYVARRALGMRGDAVNAAGTRYPLSITADSAADARADAFVREHGLDGGFVVANVSAQFADRDWPPSHCGACLALVLERHEDLTVVVTPAPGKSAPAREAAARCGAGRVVVAPELPLTDLVALVRRSVAVLTPNTALVHIAAACGRPVVALYTSEPGAEASLWSPLGVPYRALSARRGVAVDDISPAAVADAFDALRAAAPTGDVAVVAKR